jgi:hypothetical protein
VGSMAIREKRGCLRFSVQKWTENIESGSSRFFLFTLLGLYSNDFIGLAFDPILGKGGVVSSTLASSTMVSLGLCLALDFPAGPVWTDNAS